MILSNSKKTYLGLNERGRGKYAIDSSLQAVQMSEDGQTWQDINPRWDGNRVTGAPYDLTRDGNKLTITDKVNGKSGTIELVSVSDLKLAPEIVLSNTQVSFRHTIDAAKLPFNVQFKVSGNLNMTSKAFDDEGPLALETSLKDGILSETLTSVKSVDGQAKTAVGTIRVDPTIDVLPGNSADDCQVYWNGSVWTGATNSGFQTVGRSGTTLDKFGGGMRFLNVTVPAGATINTAYLTVQSFADYATTTVNSVIIGEKSTAPDAWGNMTNYATRRGTVVGGANDNNITSASVNWDNIGVWAANTDYNSPEIKTIIQEIIGLDGWASGNNLALFWDDHAGRGTSGVAIWRRAKSYDTSVTVCPRLHIEYTEGTTTYDLSIADGFKAGESLGIGMTAGLSIIDGIKAGDSLINLEAIMNLEIADGVKFGELLAVALAGSEIELSITDGAKFVDSVAFAKIWPAIRATVKMIRKAEKEGYSLGEIIKNHKLGNIHKNHDLGG